MMGHMEYDKVREEYVPSRITKNHLLDVNISLDTSQYFKFGGTGKINTNKSVMTEGVADTGAAVCCAPTSEIGNYGLKKSDLIDTNINLFAADRRKLKIIGCIPVVIKAKRTNRKMAETRQFLYFVEGVTKTFISRSALSAMGSVSKNFPQPDIDEFSSMAFLSDEMDLEKCSTLNVACGPKAECGCPIRTNAPDPPEPEKPLTDYKVEELKELLLQHYGSSTFNTCKHQKLPKMERPLELHVDPKVNPFAVHKPVTVPAHWSTKVKNDLDRDVRLGVIEPVPLNTPVRWCARMVVTRKHNGDPRRTVDLQPLNNACLRQTHHTAPPFQQASTVPHNTVKTCLDAWNGYHSVDLREQDREFTTFITPWGRYRYIAAPQGWLASGDAYTHRYDLITEGVQNCKRIVDDSLLYDRDIPTAFKNVSKYMTLVGRNGITLNPEKFVFAQETVEWAGFRIGPTTVEPLPEHVEAILNYPTPINLTDMRSFFALVEQVAPFHAVKPHLFPFRELLKKGGKFYWDDVIQKIFDEAKSVLAEEIIKGVTRFEINRETALLTDWSKSGVGFVLLQKYCKCAKISPVCCKGGWMVCMIGSRFNNRAETNYSPVEGEALAVANGLKKTKYYTLGCEKLTIGVDHKPLLGILNETCMEDIENPRLRRLKEKTLGWRFSLVHIPGSKLGGPDAMSRVRNEDSANQNELMISTLKAMLVPEAFLKSASTNKCNSNFSYENKCAPFTSSGEDHFISLLEGIEEEGGKKVVKENVFGAIRQSSPASVSIPDVVEDSMDELLYSIELNAKAITWDSIKEASMQDETNKTLVDWIIGGCTTELNLLPVCLRPYWRIKEQLRLHDGVPMMGDRVVVPIKLRPGVLDTLHAAHQGRYSMEIRASDTVYWPRISADIDATRRRCFTCQKIAPSQSDNPPVDPVMPEYPFQHICMDYFQLNGKSYGVFVDRYTNWPGVYQGTTSFDVCSTLARVSEDYGIPETCSTDGGSNYTSNKAQQFMKDYGIKHRISSVAFAHSNCRAELGVKTMKRLIRDNVKNNGNLDTAKFSRALLQYRNTRDRDTGKSPAEHLMGRQLRDFIPKSKAQLVGPVWTRLASQREKALSLRNAKLKERLSVEVKKLKPLKIGDTVIVQNQTGNHPLRWDKTGKVIKVRSFNQYEVMMHGSRRITLRNRKFLRQVDPLLIVTGREEIVLTADKKAPDTIVPAPSVNLNPTIPQPPVQPTTIEPQNTPAPEPEEPQNRLDDIQEPGGIALEEPPVKTPLCLKNLKPNLKGLWGDTPVASRMRSGRN